MIAQELLSAEIDPVQESMTGEDAMNAMQLHDLLHIPVTRNEKYLGLVSEDDILKYNRETPIEHYSKELPRPFVKRFEHLFDVMKKMADLQVTSIPVLDDQGDYLGLIHRENLLQYYSNSFAWSEPGSILVIELDSIHYSLAEISRIIEAEHGVVLSSIISRPSEAKIMVTLKVNQLDISRIIAALRRYEYDVKASYAEEEVVDTFKEKYDAFMRYLDV